MSTYNLDILAFIEVVKSDLIPLEAWHDLLSLAERMPTDPEDLYEVIEQWLQPADREPIRAKWQEFIKNLEAGLSATGRAIDNPTTMAPGGYKPQTTPEQPATDPSLKVILTNEISLYKARNFPDQSSFNKSPNPSNKPIP